MMEKRYNVKLKSFLHSFDSLKRNLSNTTSERDLLLKAAFFDFSTCIEQCWKTIKYFLETGLGIDEKIIGSKTAFKYYMNAGYINEDDYNDILSLIDLRNTLSHEYNDYQFESYYSEIPKYISILEKIEEQLLVIKEEYSIEFSNDLIEINGEFLDDSINKENDI